MVLLNFTDINVSLGKPCVLSFLWVSDTPGTTNKNQYFLPSVVSHWVTVAQKELVQEVIVPATVKEVA